MNRCCTTPVAAYAPSIGLALALLIGCGRQVVHVVAPKPPPPTPPTTLALNLSASGRLNPGADGRAAPLLLRVYELAADGRFMTADSGQLLDADQTALGADLVARQEVHLVPGQQYRIDQTLNPATRAIGVMAAYRLTDGVRWRAALPIRSAQVNAFALTLGPRELALPPGP